MATITYSETLETTVCWCGIHLAVPANLLRNAHEDGMSIHCPLGHSFSWKETEADRLRKKLAAEERRTASLVSQLDQERASHRATKGQLTKTAKRVAKGVCPCCNRSFVNLARHMQGKHPDYAQS